MTFLTVRQASTVYECASEASTNFHRVSCPALADYARSIKQLRMSLLDEAEADPWSGLLGKARWYLFLACSSVLPFSHAALGGAQILAELQQTLAHVQDAFLAHASLATGFLDTLAAIVQLHENPLFFEIAALLDANESGKTALLVRQSRLIEQVQAAINVDPWVGDKDIEVVHAAELRDTARFGRLIVVGAASWYQDREYLFSAPRARRIDVLRYSFVRDRWKAPVSFPRMRTDGHGPSKKRFHGDDELEAELVDVQPHRPDVQQLLKEITPLGHQHHELVDAVLVTLEGDDAVFLDADEDSWALVIDLHADEGSRVQRIEPPTRVQPGMFLLLRTEGSGDYIVPVANRLLRDRAGVAREAQQRWKQRLRSRVEEQGYARVVQQLKDQGSERASYQNVRNWCSYKHIKTRDYRDFLAILQCTGLGAEAKAIWDLMGEIQTAHVAAGQRIRALLLSEIARADLGSLQKRGVMEFALPDEAGGSLTAFRVEAISSETFPVPPSHLGHPVGKAGSIWHE